MKFIIIFLLSVVTSSVTLASTQSVSCKQAADYDDCVFDQYQKSTIVGAAVSEVEAKGYACDQVNVTLSYTTLPFLKPRISVKMKCGSASLKVISNIDISQDSPSFNLNEVIFKS
jgi:hypothetical protein